MAVSLWHWTTPAAAKLIVEAGFRPSDRGVFLSPVGEKFWQHPLSHPSLVEVRLDMDEEELRQYRCTRIQGREIVFFVIPDDVMATRVLDLRERPLDK
jgi:hypothetical protein